EVDVALFAASPDQRDIGQPVAVEVARDDLGSRLLGAALEGAGLRGPSAQGQVLEPESAPVAAREGHGDAGEVHAAHQRDVAEAVVVEVGGAHSPADPRTSGE